MSQKNRGTCVFECDFEKHINPSFLPGKGLLRGKEGDYTPKG